MNEQCPKCGAPREPILSQCAFCKTAFPDKEFKQMSDEELIGNATEWVGRCKLKFYYPESGKSVFSVPKMLLNEDIQAIAQKYIDLLEIRSSTSAVLSGHVSVLKTRLDQNVKYQKQNYRFIVIGIFMFLFIGIGALSVTAIFNSISKDRTEKQIQQYIESGELDKAELLIPELSSNIDRDEKEMTAKRKFYLDIIESRRKNKRGK